MTVRQVQYLLLFLGYDPGQADGVSGQKTQAAVRAFQGSVDGLEVDGIAGEETQKALRKAVAEGAEASEKTGFWGEIQFFDRQEFACRCPRCGGFPVEPEEKLVRLADQVRIHFGKPITVSSGVRCREHNAEVGGVSNSRHLLGKAMDFTVGGVGAEAVLAFVRQLGVRYAYAIDSNFVHMDII